MSTVIHLDPTDVDTGVTLQAAMEGSYYTICGVARYDLESFIAGYSDIFDKRDNGQPAWWVYTSGSAVNAFLGSGPDGTEDYPVKASSYFKSDIGILMFPIEGMQVGSLAMTKMLLEDRWFDDVVDNARLVSTRVSYDEDDEL